MVRAILDGRKTQTRRIVKLSEGERLDYLAGKVTFFADEGKFLRCPYGQPGDQLWVRETFTPSPLRESGCEIKYEAGYVVNFNSPDFASSFKKSRRTSPLFMPRWASRITLEIVAVRVERLHTITEKDAIAEGIYFDHDFDGYVSDDEGRHYHGNSAARSYEHLWHSINGPESWDANPWVWVVEFKKLQP